MSWVIPCQKSGRDLWKVPLLPSPNIWQSSLPHSTIKFVFSEIGEEKWQEIFPHCFQQLLYRNHLMFLKLFCLIYMTFWKVHAVSDIFNISRKSVPFFKVCRQTAVNLLGRQIPLVPLVTVLMLSVAFKLGLSSLPKVCFRHHFYFQKFIVAYILSMISARNFFFLIHRPTKLMSPYVYWKSLMKNI